MTRKIQRRDGRAVLNERQRSGIGAGFQPYRGDGRIETEESKIDAIAGAKARDTCAELIGASIKTQRLAGSQICECHVADNGPAAAEFERTDFDCRAARIA